MPTTHAIDERKGVPLVSHLGWTLTVILSGVSCGLLIIGIPLNISYFVWRKSGRGFALFIYLLIAVSFALDLLPNRVWPSSIAWQDFSTAASLAIAILWVASSFILRRELMLYYASPEGGVLEISPWWTALFSVFYLNYCLWVVRDSA